LYNNPVEYNPTPRESVFIEDPELYKQTEGKLYDVAVIVTHSLKGITRYGYRNGTETSDSIEPGENKTLTFQGRIDTIIVRKV